MKGTFERTGELEGSFCDGNYFWANPITGEESDSVAASGGCSGGGAVYYGTSSWRVFGGGF